MSFEEVSDMYVLKRNGSTEIVAFDKILNRLKKIGKETIMGVGNLKINYTTLTMKVIDQLYDCIHTKQIDELSAEQCASLASTHPDYNSLAGRIVVSNHQKNTSSLFSETMRQLYTHVDRNGNASPMISELAYTLSQRFAAELDEMCVYDRDYLIDYFGFKTLERAYLLRVNKRPIERPQHMWLRVALGIHGDDLARVRETYDFMSQKYFTHATPTLFNSGTPHQQLSSCYLIAMENDSIDGIYNTLKDCAMISKWAGGIGLHIHNIRASGSYIHGTGGTSNGLAPMLRVFNNTAKYVDQCFTPDTTLYTTRGPIPIAHAVSGITAVLNRDGTSEVVENVLEHIYEGDILEITVANHKHPLRVTPEHLIYGVSVVNPPMNPATVYNELGAGLLQVSWMDARELCPGDYIVQTIPSESTVRDFAELTLDICFLYGRMLSSIERTEEPNRDEYRGSGAYSPDRYFYVRNTAEYLQPIVDYMNAHCIEHTVSKSGGSALLYWPKTVNLPFRETDFWEPNTGHRHISERWLFLPKDKTAELLRGIGEAQTHPHLYRQVQFLTLRSGVLQTDEIQYEEKILVPVVSVKRTPYRGVVYDLQMTHQHNYMVEHALVHNGGGKRNGSFAIYLEPWHSDVETFLQMRKNHGDEELKARDLFYALWIPDLFMERIKAGGTWTLFCPDECPGLSDVYGDDFVELYTKYESSGRGRKTMPARDLWFQILDSQMETGTPYILFKDACNKKSNQKNLGTIKSSNLCTEIIQYSDNKETAVCNLASIALPMFVDVESQTFDYAKLHAITKVVTYNLNRVIDVNFYPTEKTRLSNMKHRPVGLGVQGLADVFIMMGFPFHSERAKEVNRDIFETIYHAAVEQSCDIAQERHEKYREQFISERMVKRDCDPDVFTPDELEKLDIQRCGAYSTFIGSPMSKGIFQFNMWDVSPSDRYDWNALRSRVIQYGMRNSLLVAPMPTASTSQILGYNECIEPITSNIYSRRTIAGEFIMANKYLMNDLIQLGLWNERVKNNIIANNGSIQQIDTIPHEIREKYKTVWEIPMRHIIDMAADRGAFICQSQSLNLWVEDPTYSVLTSMHFHSWNRGLKTGIYYLRRRGKHQAQQFTIEPTQQSVNTGHDDEICEMCSA